jgi:hypothetical protein
MSYNNESGYHLNEGSYANANYSNSYYNGFGSGSGADDESDQSGFSVVDASKAKAEYAHSMFNYGNGFYANNHSYLSHASGTADNNQLNAFKAEYDSTLKLATSSYGGTADGVSGAPGAGTDNNFDEFGYGIMARSDSTVFKGSMSVVVGGHTSDTDGAIRAY